MPVQYINRMKRILLVTGAIIPVVFWTSTFIGGLLHGNYNHLRDTISQLGAIGTRSETFMTISTWLCVALSICFFTGLFISITSLRTSRIPLIGVVGFAIMFGWAAVFHSGNPLHSRGGASLILLLLAPLLTALLWKGERFRTIKKMSLISFGLMLMILLRAIPSASLQENYTGLIQRFVHLGWSVWFISLSLKFLNHPFGQQR